MRTPSGIGINKAKYLLQRTYVYDYILRNETRDVGMSAFIKLYHANDNVMDRAIEIVAPKDILESEVMCSHMYQQCELWAANRLPTDKLDELLQDADLRNYKVKYDNKK